ncbi:hypothetical protein MBLNU459_g5576t1 [Dothideomycetes sp. NU459]
MNNLFSFLLLQTLLVAQCARADDVGVEFNPSDGEAWELDYGYYPYRSYQTTNLISPELRTLIDSPECHDDRYIMLTPRGYSISAPGPMILDNNGDMIWAKTTEGQAYDLVVQEYNGEQYLTYWIGDDRVRGHGQGNYYMLDSSYQQVAKISALGGLAADLHELVITPQGTAILTIYELYQHDLTFLGREFSPEEAGMENYIWDCLFQEIDLETNELVFQWRASDHHSLTESYKEVGGYGTKESPFDWYHINSVQKDELGNYIVSARYTHSVTYINGTTGETIWVLGGKRNAFQDLSGGKATDFAWQHDASFHPLTTFPNLLRDTIASHGVSRDKNGVTKQLVSLFDNAAEDQRYSNPISRGLLLEVTYPSVAPQDGEVTSAGDLNNREAAVVQSDAYTVRLVQSYDHPQGVISSSQGSFQVVPDTINKGDPKIMLGYGYNAVWTEYAANGAVLCDNHFATNYSWERGDVQSYRTFKYNWVGKPLQPPAAALGDEVVFVSWNGATEVTTWILQHSSQYQNEHGEWQDIATVQKDGFETELNFDEDTVMRYLRVAAVDEAGRIIGLSRAIDMGWTVGLTSAIPQLRSTNMAPLKLIMVFACNVSLLFVLFEVYRRVLTWRRNRKWRYYKGIRLGSDGTRASYA